MPRDSSLSNPSGNSSIGTYASTSNNFNNNNNNGGNGMNNNKYNVA